jgi:hypothetical protein
MRPQCRHQSVGNPTLALRKSINHFSPRDWSPNAAPMEPPTKNMLFKPTPSQGITMIFSFDAALATVMETVFDTAKQVFSTGLPQGSRGAHTLNLLHQTLYQALAPSKHGAPRKTNNHWNTHKKQIINLLISCFSCLDLLRFGSAG